MTEQHKGLLLELICMKHGGCSKSEIVRSFGRLCDDDDFVPDVLRYASRLRAKGVGFMLAPNTQRRWQTLDNREFCRGLLLTLFSIGGTKPDVKPPNIPQWMHENWEVVWEVFGNDWYVPTT